MAIGAIDWNFFLEVLVGGLLSGVMYSLVAIGFVLIYKTSSVLNFAQRQFASKHAEGMFVLTTSIAQAREMTDDIRTQAEKQGRSRDAIKIFTLLTVITGATDEAAERKYQEFQTYASSEGMLALYGGWTGIDFAQYDPEEPLQALDNDSLRTTLESLLSGDHGQTWTVRDVIKERSIGGLGPVLVGGPQKVCDMLERWVDEGGIDGFNLAYAITPGTVTDFIDHIVPELQRRGRAQKSHASGTFRQKLIGTPDGRVQSTHPAASFRGAYAGRENVADKTTGSNFARGERSRAAE